jgi:dihydroxyacetone kinase DhaKLM complex PTS-EIIA-like component DhaM
MSILNGVVAQSVKFIATEVAKDVKATAISGAKLGGQVAAVSGVYGAVQTARATQYAAKQMDKGSVVVNKKVLSLCEKFAQMHNAQFTLGK